MLIDLILPQYCDLCKRVGTRLCITCKKSILQQHNLVDTCFVCELPTNNGFTHKRCFYDLKNSPLQTVSRFNYAENIKRTILSAKSSGAKKHTLNLIIAKSIDYLKSTLKTKIDLVTPIPRSFKLKRPLFAVNIPWLVTQKINIDLNTNIITIYESPPFVKSQKELHRQDRFSNINNSLFLKQNIEKGLLKGKNILVVDDVLTTGATLHRASSLLQNLDVNTVSFFTLARDIKVH